MLWLRRLILMFPWARRHREQTLDEELRSHMEMAAEETSAAGASAVEARYAARRDLGSPLRVQEQVRGEWFLPGVERFQQDLRYACRTLPRSPLFTVVAVLSLGLGIGAATAIFSLVEGVLLKPLAYPEADRLQYIQEVVPALAHIYPTMPVNIQHFFYWHDHTRAFESIAAVRADRPTLTGMGEPSPIDGIETTADLFRVLRVDMAQGRGFLPGEDRPGRNHVAVITDSLWRRRFGGEAGVVGRSILLDGLPTTVVGILASGFTFPKGSDLGRLAGLGKRTEIIRPLQETIPEWDGDYDYICIGRLRPSVAPAQALAELGGLNRQFITAYHVDSLPRPVLRPLRDLIAGSVRTSLLVLMAAVLALLLIVCLNLANLVLARASVRTREFSIRTALGAGKMRLVQQVLTETAVLSLCGGLLGVTVSGLAIRLFVASAGARLPRLDEVGLDWQVLLFAVSITVACAALFGLLPAYRIVRSDPQDALKGGAHTASANRQSLRLREALIGFEVALSTVLLFVAGLLISSVFHLLRVEKGFTQERAFAIDLSLPETQYRTVQDRNRFFDRALADIQSIPGVRSAGMIMGLPLTGESHVNGIELEGSDKSWIGPSNKDSILINVRFISPDYFSTLGIPLLHGRAIEPRDMTRHVAVVSERFAAKVWAAQDPVGKRFRTGSGAGELEVIGVVKDVHNGRLDQDPTLIAYVPYSLRGPNYGSLVVRTAADPAQVMPAIRETIWSIDSQLPVPPFVTLAELVNEAAAARRFQMRLSTAFGAGALALALIGIYGVVAYNVSARRPELGIRLALGASGGELIALLVWRGLRPAFLGLGVGLLASAGCGWLVRSLLFGVGAIDPLTLAMVALILMSTAFLACLLPACAVARMDPATTLRYE
jgi:predicted permease